MDTMLECPDCGSIRFKRNWENELAVEAKCSFCGHTIHIGFESGKLHDKPSFHEGEIQFPKVPDRLKRGY